MKNGKLFRFVQCDIEVPVWLGTDFANFPPIFKNVLVRQIVIGDLMKSYAEEKVYCLNLSNCWFRCSHYKGTLITPLHHFIFNRARFAEKHTVLLSTLRKCFTSFARSAVDAGRQGDEIQSPVFLQRQCISSLMPSMAIGLRRAAIKLWQSTSETRRDMSE